MDLVLKPVRIATSKPARRTYLNTILLLATSGILLGFASFAYVLFYLNFIPQISIERAIHLQFGGGDHEYSLGWRNPYAFVSLDSAVVVQQVYDIKVEMELPRSPPNLEAGNFMLDMTLLTSAYKTPSSPSNTPPNIRDSIPLDTVLFSSRRPAILTYHSRLVRLSKQVAGLPWYLLGWRREAEKLEVIMAEGVHFPKGAQNVPETVYLELQGHNLQVYTMQLKLRTRFSGLRWLMYNHRIFSFVVFTTAFWGVEMIFAIFAWLLWSWQTGAEEVNIKGEVKGEDTDQSIAIKTEKEEEVDTDDLDLSDTPRSFPTYGRQAPLRYVSKVKDENNEGLTMDETAIQPLAAEADDESEEPVNVGSFHGGRSDSGIGTSFSEGPESMRGNAQRRRSASRK